MRKAIKLFIIGLTGMLISITLSISCLHSPIDFGFLSLSNPSRVLMPASIIFLIEGALFSAFGYVEDKHETWLNRCAHTLASYEKRLSEAAKAEKIRHRG